MKSLKFYLEKNLKFVFPIIIIVQLGHFCWHVLVLGFSLGL
jgi:hypothetical protein